MDCISLPVSINLPPSLPFPAQEKEDVAAARESYWETRDAATALAQFPKGRTIEVQLLRGLAEREAANDLLGALNFVCVYM